MKRLLPVIAALLAGSVALVAANLPNIPAVSQVPSTAQYAEASQIVNTVNYALSQVSTSLTNLVNQLNGVTGYTTATPTVSLGLGCTGAGTATATCTGQRGLVTFTAVPAIALGASSGNFVVTNTGISTASVCVFTPTSATAGLVFVSAVVPTANTLTMTLGSTGAYAGGVMTFAFICM